MKLKEFRGRHELTQGDIAIKCRVSLSTARTWEKGYGKPNEEGRENLIKLFESYGEEYEE